MAEMAINHFDVYNYDKPRIKFNDSSDRCKISFNNCV